jgi:hypothetical protein
MNSLLFGPVLSNESQFWAVETTLWWEAAPLDQTLVAYAVQVHALQIKKSHQYQACSTMH